jgi:hypothetical protein
VDQEIRDLVATCAKDNDKNPLWPSGHTDFCDLHGITLEHFCYLFARRVAEEFARGYMAYTDADAAMNSLFGVVAHDLNGFAWDIFEAFDSGEFLPQGDPPDTIPWQKYTLPQVMEALAGDSGWPRA